MKKLSELEKDSEGVIASVDGDPRFMSRITSIGLTPGCSVKVIKNEKNKTVIALLGQPNSGKSTLFNALTGMRQHVGNWPGKTVEKKEGTFSHNGKDYLVADLPGTYSLSANSDEEMITRDYIASGKADVVCILADSSQLERSLYMLSDYAGIKVPCFLVLNMSDVAKEQGKSVDAKLIEDKYASFVRIRQEAENWQIA